MVDMNKLDLTRVKVLNKNLDLKSILNKDKIYICDDSSKFIETIKSNEAVSKLVENITSYNDLIVSLSKDGALELNKIRYNKTKLSTLTSLDDLVTLYDVADTSCFDLILNDNAVLLKLKRTPSYLFDLLEKDKLKNSYGFIYPENKDIYLLLVY